MIDSYVTSFVSTNVEIRHLNSSSHDLIRFVFLSSWHLINKSLPLPSTYTGTKPLIANKVISIVGVPSAEMEQKDVAVYEEAMIAFLTPRLFKKGVNITYVVVVGQNLIYSHLDNDVPPKVRHGRMNEQISSAESSIPILEVETKVTGLHRPPPNINLDELVEDSINADGDVFMDELKSNDKTGYFSNVTGVMGSPGISQFPSTAPSPRNDQDFNGNQREISMPNDGARNGLGWILFASITFVVLLLFLCRAWWWIHKKRSIPYQNLHVPE